MRERECSGTIWEGVNERRRGVALKGKEKERREGTKEKGRNTGTRKK